MMNILEFMCLHDFWTTYEQLGSLIPSWQSQLNIPNAIFRWGKSKIMRWYKALWNAKRMTLALGNFTPNEFLKKFEEKKTKTEFIV